MKTAALPPCLSRRNLLAVKSDEVPLTGSGCVKGCVSGQTGKFEQSQNTPAFFDPPPHKAAEDRKGLWVGGGEGKNFGADVRPFLVKRSFPLPQEPSTLVGNSAF